VAVDVLEVMRARGLEEVVAVNDPATGLSGFIVIHDTTRGPAIGGCRFLPYRDAREALADGAALAVAMTRKCALAGLNAGGGKGVFIENPDVRDRGEAMRALGRFVESLGGRFYTGGDLGVGPAEVAHMRQTTRFVAVPDERTLDLSGAVADGVLAAMRATLAASGLGEELRGRTVVVQGLGVMGSRVAKRLAVEGARVVAADLDAHKAEKAGRELGARVVPAADVYDQEADVFCPCATSGVLTGETADRLRVKAVVGAANNQIGDSEADRRLLERGIRYAPDYAVNAGAMILAAKAYLEHIADVRETIGHAAGQIAETVTRIFEVSDDRGEPPGAVADRLADEALLRPRDTSKQWWPIR
jgi:glutamate dehydrogenase/leucine dehydrogenase